MIHMNEFVICLTTCEEQDEQVIARKLVEKKLCACVNIVHRVTSIYHWKDKIETSTEGLLIIKSRKDKVKEIEATLREIHPYEVPEFIVLDIAGGSEKYLQWITDSVTD